MKRPEIFAVPHILFYSKFKRFIKIFIIVKVQNSFSLLEIRNLKSNLGKQNLNL